MINTLMMNQLENVSWWIGLRETLFQKQEWIYRLRLKAKLKFWLICIFLYLNNFKILPFIYLLSMKRLENQFYFIPSFDRIFLKLHILYYKKCICELLDVARGFLLRNNLLLLERRREKIRTLSLFLVLVKWRLQKMMSVKKTASHPPKHNVTIQRGHAYIVNIQSRKYPLYNYILEGVSK